MQKKKLTHHETFFAVSRGIIEHLKYWNGTQVKIYIYCLANVKPVGKEKGIMTGYVKNWIEEIGLDKSLFHKTIKTMDTYLNFEPSKNRHHPAKIIVLRYKGIEDFYCGKKDHPSSTVVPQYFHSSSTVNSVSTIKTNDLQAPNNIDNINNNNNILYIKNFYFEHSKKGFEKLKKDEDWIAERKRFHPGYDISLSLEKSYLDFWGTDAGFENKMKGHKKKSQEEKSKIIENINWKSTYNNTLKFHLVWDKSQKQEQQIPKARKLN